MRLDKFLSNLKYGSRSEIKNLINKKQVKLNDCIVSNSNLKIDPLVDIVKINEEVVYYKEEINLMVNKPLGYLSANSDKLHQVVIDLIKEPFNRYDLKIAGRLDLDSHGLLILTTNGSFVHEITSPNNEVEKIYEVKLAEEFFELETLLGGIMIKDGNNNDYLAKALLIEKITNKHFKVTINEGKFHQVRRMFKYFDNEVIDLKRIAIGKLELDNLPVGEYKEFERSDLLWMNLFCLHMII